MYRAPRELQDLVQVYNDKSDKRKDGIGGLAITCDYGFKLIIIGDAGAGKSSFMYQFLEGKFRKTSTHTIGVEFGAKVVSIGEHNYQAANMGHRRARKISRSNSIVLSRRSRRSHSV